MQIIRKSNNLYAVFGPNVSTEDRYLHDLWQPDDLSVMLAFQIVERVSRGTLTKRYRQLSQRRSGRAFVAAHRGIALKPARQLLVGSLQQTVMVCGSFEVSNECRANLGTTNSTSFT